MRSKSIFDNVDVYERHYTSIVAETIAGGKSSLDEKMIDAVYACATNGENQLAPSDIDILINHKLVNMFERNSNGTPFISPNVIIETLRKAAGKIGNIVVTKNLGDDSVYAASVFIDKNVKIADPTICLYDNEYGEPLKFGELKPVTFKDADGNSLVRYVEVFENVSMIFCVESIYDTNAWPAIWKVAESNGIGGARYHGYGKFVVTDWS